MRPNVAFLIIPPQDAGRRRAGGGEEGEERRGGSGNTEEEEASEVEVIQLFSAVCNQRLTDMDHWLPQSNNLTQVRALTVKTHLGPRTNKV